MDAQRTVLRSGRRLRIPPAPRRRRKSPDAQPSDALPAAAEGAREGERDADDPAARIPGAAAAAQFGCNVCLEAARDPVVTHCGHLFCWPCLYIWVGLHSLSRDCPVCKSAVEIGLDGSTVTPIYGRGEGSGGAGAGDPGLPPRPQGRRIHRPGGGAATVGEVLEEVRQRAEVLRRQAQMRTIDRTRAAIDRVRANLQAVEGLVREFSLRAARLRVGQMSVEVERLNVTTFSEGTSDQNNRGAERVAGRTRRREEDHNPQNGSGNANDDGVYRGTRRRLAAERES